MKEGLSGRASPERPAAAGRTVELGLDDAHQLALVADVVREVEVNVTAAAALVRGENCLTSVSQDEPRSPARAGNDAALVEARAGKSLMPASS
jgi:hypothetical protein